MSGPQELSLTEIRKYMLENNCKVTNHALVKHFKRFLTHHETQNEARKQFKTYVNILATIKTENNQKYLILRKKYINECPTEEVVQRAVAASSSHSGAVPSSPGDVSIISEGSLSSPAPFRQPPPYKPPPEVLKPTTGLMVNQENSLNYRDCVKEFAASVQRIDPRRLARQTSSPDESEAAATPKDDTQLAAAAPVTPTPTSTPSNKENLPRLSVSSVASEAPSTSNSSDGLSLDGASSSAEGGAAATLADGGDDNPMSVKEATRKFNRMASVEEAKIISPPSKKKPEKDLVEEKVLPEVSLSHPKAKEWLVSMSRANYQELAKLASESPELVKLQDPATGYTALHWAAKHGDEDVVKLIAGTYKANVNATSNGGYTPLHLAMQFGRVNIFELLCNVYKANRDVMDYSGKKPLEYRMQRTSVSASTYSKIKAKRKHTEKDLGFLRIGSLNVRVKKTTEAFSNFLGVGNGNGQTGASSTTRSDLAALQQRSHRHHHPLHHHHGGTMRTHHHAPRHHHHHLTTMTMQHKGSTSAAKSQATRASVPISSSKFDKLHKSWGSADNILPDSGSGLMLMMPPPPPTASKDGVKKRQKSASKRGSVISNATADSPRDSISSSNSSTTMASGYSSMPSTPNQLRSPLGGDGLARGDIGDSDSDSACGFGSNWSVGGRSSTLSGGHLK